jgi:TatD DNase family protein
MAIDTHMHINSKVLTYLNPYIKRLNENKSLESAINVGLDIKTSKESVLLSSNNSKFYSSVGIHPLYINDQECNELYELIDSKVVAIGEIGLDSNSNNYLAQKKYFIKQIMIANEVHLPVIIHANNTNKEVIEVFKKFVKPKYGCVFHCFQPDFDTLEYLMDNGYYISFAGRVTYKTAKESIEIAKYVPDNLFLVETDSPYISPEPLRETINESTNIKYIIQKLAEIRESSYSEIENITTINAKQIFKKIKLKTI